MNRYKIRAHHGMCLGFFEGKGYSDVFTVHMGNIKRELEHNPRIHLVNQADEICKYCPNNKDDICECYDKVLHYDDEVLLLCGLEADTEIEWKQFSSLVEEKIIKTGKRMDICGDCEWNSICQ